MKTLITLGATLTVGILALIIAAVTVTSTYNQASRLQVAYDAKVSANMASFDNMKVQIAQVAEVSQVQLDKLKEIFNSYAEARTPKGDEGAIMRWVQESVPNVDTSTMNNLQNIISSTRNGWTRNQIELVDISREYNQMLRVVPSNFILGFFQFKEIDPKVITSANTKKTFETGEDNDNAVFSK